MTDGAGAPTGEGTNSLADEVRKFVSGVQSWARGVADDQQHVHTRTCDWCPLCQFADVVRRENPEVAEKLAEAGTALMSALRVMVDAATASAQSAQPGTARPRPRPSPSVQHIALDDSDEA